MGLPEMTLPKDPEAMMGYDCIILGDVGPEQFTRGERDQLEKYVSERGGTLVLLAGKRSMPIGVFEGRRAAREDAADLDAQGSQGRCRLPRGPHGRGTANRFLAHGTECGLDAETWNNLPPHFWAITGRAKEGAVTLASIPQADTPMIRLPPARSSGTMR